MSSLGVFGEQVKRWVSRQALDKKIDNFLARRLMPGIVFQKADEPGGALRATRDQAAALWIDSDSQMARQAIENAQNGLGRLGGSQSVGRRSNQATVVHINYLRPSRRIYGSGRRSGLAKEPQGG